MDIESLTNYKSIVGMMSSPPPLLSTLSPGQAL